MPRVPPARTRDSSVSRTLDTVVPQANRLIAQAHGSARGAGANAAAIGSLDWAAQTFPVGQAVILSRVDVRIQRTGLPGTAVLGIRRAVSAGTMGAPTGDDLGSVSFNANSLPVGTWTGGELRSLLLSPVIKLVLGSQYAIVLRAPTGQTGFPIRRINWPIAGSRGQTFNGRVFISNDGGAGPWNRQIGSAGQVVWGRFSTFGYLEAVRSLDP